MLHPNKNLNSHGTVLTQGGCFQTNRYRYDLCVASLHYYDPSTDMTPCISRAPSRKICMLQMRPGSAMSHFVVITNNAGLYLGENTVASLHTDYAFCLEDVKT
jgi:hypothetical protein